MEHRDSINLSQAYLTRVYPLLCEQYYHDRLNSRFWSSEKKFDKNIRKKLLTIAEDFFKDQNLNIPIIDVQLTGSLANYNYTKYSDLDVHVILDFSLINKDVKLVKKALDGIRFIWNARHDIVIRGHDVELYYQDANEQHTASGLYSLLHNKWIRKPSYNPPEIDERDVDNKYENYLIEVEKMEEILNNSPSKKELEEVYRRAEKLKDKIQKDRKECLLTGDEFCVENLVFKKLRNTGVIEQLINIRAKAYDNMFNEQASSI
jgi:hypothetical protein